jgi:hypothetical protein
VKKSTKENTLIIAIVLAMALAVLFGIAFEVLKFVAVVKWVFT